MEAFFKYVIIFLICIIAFFYCKMVLIWKDVMIEQNNKRIKELEKLNITHE